MQFETEYPASSPLRSLRPSRFKPAKFPRSRAACVRAAGLLSVLPLSQTMPTYEYHCEKCGKNFDCYQSMKDPVFKVCPKEHCRQKKWGKGKVKRQLGTGAGLIFKGSGFYITDYRSAGYKESAKNESAAASPSKAPEKTAVEKPKTDKPKTDKPKPKE
jgi:putative FmdB family regulatory protein